MGRRPPDAVWGELPPAVQAWAALPTPVPLALQRCATRSDEVDEVRDLLMAYAEPDPTNGPAGLQRAMAEVLAIACLGDNHLWQDLQLGSRAELSQLFERHFPRLAARNTQHMKWKKFLYKQLCEREEIFVCKSPSCAVSSDYAQCFGPESP